jgi:MFS family permease
MAAASSVLHNRNVLLFLAARFCSAMAVMMVSVAVGWQVYAITHSPFALGMVGLAQFLPAFALSLPGGLAADRFDRRRVLMTSFAVEILVGALLLALAFHPAPSPYWIFGVVAFIGVGRAFMAPANGSLLPVLVEPAQFPRAVAWNSTAFQSAIIAGPALGGILYAVGPGLVYGIATGLLVLGFGFTAALRGSFHVPNRRFSAPFRSICSRCCSAALPRSCPSSPGTCCTRGPGASGSCGARPPSAPR